MMGSVMQTGDHMEKAKAVLPRDEHVPLKQI